MMCWKDKQGYDNQVYISPDTLSKLVNLGGVAWCWKWKEYNGNLCFGKNPYVISNDITVKFI
jgi:hypothetical protein